jgi:hypothetical protein
VEAEARLLDAGRDTSGPAVSYGAVARVREGPLPGRAYQMGPDQAVAVEQVATSGHVCDVQGGPAGTGKTVAVSGLLAVWEAEHGPGSVKGLLRRRDRTPPRVSQVEKSPLRHMK